MNGIRTLRAVSRPQRHQFPTGSYAHMINGADLGQSLDPFIQIDHFRMAHPTFPPHPHAGLSAVTYMLDDAETGFINRDSLGDRSDIRAGDLHWTQAAGGMLHEEVPAETGRWAHGLQIFVNIPARHKRASPRAFHLAREQRPEIELPGAKAFVVVGELGGRQSPITSQLLMPVDIYDVRGLPGAVVDIPLRQASFNVFMVMLAGSVEAGDVTLEAGMVGHFGREGGDVVRVTAGPAGAWWTLMSGSPLDEPLVTRGPFAGTSSEDIAWFMHRYQTGEMGALARSF